MSDPTALLMKGYSYNACTLQLGKLIQQGTINENTDIDVIVDLLNEKLVQLKLPALTKAELMPHIFTLKGFNLFKREGAPREIQHATAVDP
jgi:hypothetical protein